MYIKKKLDYYNLILIIHVKHRINFSILYFFEDEYYDKIAHVSRENNLIFFLEATHYM